MVNPKIVTLVTSTFDDAIANERAVATTYERLFFGIRGTGTSRGLEFILTSQQKISTPSSGRSPALVDGCGRATTVEEIRSLTQVSQQLSEPLARPSK